MDAIREHAFSAVFVVSTWLAVGCAVLIALGALAAAKVKTPR